jgi:hypothetical protein
MYILFHANLKKHIVTKTIESLCLDVNKMLFAL